MSVRSYALAGSDEPRTVFDDTATQVVEAADLLLATPQQASRVLSHVARRLEAEGRSV